MKTQTCAVCTLTFQGEKCPNGWRADKGGVLRMRAPGKHEEARGHIERYRQARAAALTPS